MRLVMAPPVIHQASKTSTEYFLWSQAQGARRSRPLPPSALSRRQRASRHRPDRDGRARGGRQRGTPLPLHALRFLRDIVPLFPGRDALGRLTPASVAVFRYYVASSPKLINCHKPNSLRGMVFVCQDIFLTNPHYTRDFSTSNPMK
jgi:hypothetical protein